MAIWIDSENTMPAIWIASREGHLDIVEKLLADPCTNPSMLNNAAIRWASRHGHIAIVNRLLEDPRVDPSDVNNTAMQWAYDNTIAELLLLDPRVASTYTGPESVAKAWMAMNRNLKFKQELLECAFLRKAASI